MTERLKYVKHTLMDLVEEQMEHLESVNTCELGEVIDMIKDIEEAIYYCTVTEAMHQGGYTDAKYGCDKSAHDMHTDGGSHSADGGHSYCGPSCAQRRVYMESKQMHHGKAKQLQELEKYMKDLSTDLMEMIDDASAEEKQYLGSRLSTLATKISKLEG